jgi:hypothetical protein
MSVEHYSTEALALSDVPSRAPSAGGWRRVAKVRLAILLWALGVPIPLVLLVLLIRSCM